MDVKNGSGMNETDNKNSKIVEIQGFMATVASQKVSATYSSICKYTTVLLVGLVVYWENGGGTDSEDIENATVTCGWWFSIIPVDQKAMLADVHGKWYYFGNKDNVRQGNT